MPLYVANDVATPQIQLIPEGTANNGTAVADAVFTLPQNVDHNGVTVSINDPNALAIDGNNLYIGDSNALEIFVVPANTGNGNTASITRRFTVPSTVGTIAGLAIDGNDLYIANNVNDNIYVVAADTADNTEATITRTITSPSTIGNPQGLAIDGNDLYIADSTDDAIYTVNKTTSGSATITRTINLPSEISTPLSITIQGNSLYIGDGTDDDIYEIDKDTADETEATIIKSFNLPSGLTEPKGLTFAESDATLTITTTETNLYAGKTFDVNITSDIDISNFVVGDVTVTGGTANSLTETDAQNFVLNVTVGSAGTLNVDIAADVVTPGNAAVDEDFTIVARATVGIVFDDSTLEAGESTTARIIFSGAVTGLALDDFSVNVGSVTNLQESTSNSYTATVTAPSSGSGTLTLTLRENAVDQGNAVETESLTYSPPADAVLNITVSSANVLTGTSPVVTFTFNKAVTGFTAADVTVSTDAIKGTLADNGDNTFDMPVTAPATGSGTVTVSVSADVVSPGNNADSVTFDYAEPTITLLHIADGDDDNFRVIPTDTADSDDATVYRTYTIPNATDVQSLVFDGTHFHITNWNSNTVIAFGPNTQDGQSGTVVRTYTVTDISQPSGMAFDGTNLHISDRNDDNIRVIAPDTANGGTATVLRTYEVPNAGDIRSMTFDGTNIHAADYTDDNIRVFAPDTADNDDATVLRTYTVPDANHIRAISFDGTHIHVSDVTDDNFRVIAVPTTGGAQTVLRTYEVPGVNLPRGMAHVALPPDEAVFTITAADTDIRAGESFPVRIVSNIDISDFVVGDITVTGGTANSLTETDAQNFVLSVTAGSAGTLNIAIAADVVSPGNAAADRDFTVNALATATISISPTTLTENDAATLTIQFSETVSNFATGNVTVRGATKGTFTAVDGDTYTQAITVGSGSGTVDVSIAARVTTPPNAAVSESFTYTADTIPGAPTSFAATVGETTADLSWVIGSDGGSPITATQVTSDGGANWTNISASATSHQFTGLSPDTEYQFAARHVNSVGNGTATATLTRRTSAIPPAMASLTGPTSVRSNTSFDVTVSFDKAVTNLALSDFTRTPAAVTLNSLTPGTGNAYTLNATAPPTGSGNIVIALPANSVDEGNNAVMLTIAYTASDFVITQVGPVVITVGTTNYDLPVPISGTTANTTVKDEGDWEGFYMDWDQPNGMLHIRSEEVTRLVGEYVWLLTVSEGADSITAEIVYSVVPEAPVITPITDTQPLFRGTRMNVPIEIRNPVDVASIEGLQVGMKHQPIEEGATPGVSAKGTLPADARLTDTTFMAKVIAENATAMVESMIPFEVMNEPKMWIGHAQVASLDVFNDIGRVDAATANGETAPVFGFKIFTENSDILYTGLVIDGENAIATRKHVAVGNTSVSELITFPRNVEQNTEVAPSLVVNISSLISEPGGFIIPVNTLTGDYWILDQAASSKRIRAITTSPLQAVDTQNLPSSIGKPRGIAQDTNNDLYIVDLENRRVHVDSNKTNLASAISIDRWFGLPTGNDAPGDIFISGDNCYVLDFWDADESRTQSGTEVTTAKLYVMDKNTAPATTATATRVFDLSSAIYYPQALFIEA